MADKQEKPRSQAEPKASNVAADKSAQRTQTTSTQQAAGAAERAAKGAGEGDAGVSDGRTFRL